MKPVTGYQSEDGRFFESKAEAEYHEARSILEGMLVAEMERPELFIRILEINHVEVERFIQAYQAKVGVEAERRIAEDETLETDDASREEINDSPLELAARGGQYVPDVGRGVSAKEIQDERKKHGSRMRPRHARRFRGSTDLAVARDTRPTKARGSDGRKVVQEGSVEGSQETRNSKDRP